MKTVEEEVTVESSDTMIPLLPPAVAAVRESAHAVERQARKLEDETRRWEREVERETDKLVPVSVPIVEPIIIEEELAALRTRATVIADGLQKEIDVLREQIDGLSEQLERLIGTVPEEKKKP